MAEVVLFLLICGWVGLVLRSFVGLARAHSRGCRCDWCRMDGVNGWKR